MFFPYSYKLWRWYSIKVAVRPSGDRTLFKRGIAIALYFVLSVLAVLVFQVRGPFGQRNPAAVALVQVAIVQSFDENSL